MEKLIDFIKKIFRHKKKIKSSKTSDLNKGFYPELLFLINLPYAEYVDFKEI